MTNLEIYIFEEYSFTEINISIFLYKCYFLFYVNLISTY